jgi:ADP-ribose pyrophosphatase
VSNQPIDLTEHFVSGEEVYRGQMLRVQCDVVRLPNGQQTTREYICHPGAVAIFAIDAQDCVVLERQFRYPIRSTIIEIPAGKRDPGEPLLDCAKRELLEETGYRANNWTRMTTVHNALGYADEFIEIFIAQDLHLEKQKLDDEEFLEVLHVPFDEALAMVQDGRITDVKTQLALLWWKNFGVGAGSATR